MLTRMFVKTKMAASSVSKTVSPSKSLLIFRVKSETQDSQNGTQMTDKEFRDKLLRMVKKEVKQLMEEAVTRKFVHEDSSTIISLCAAVDACLSHGLKRRVLGLFKTHSTEALLHKVAKHFQVASVILKKVQDIENADPNKRSSSSSDSTTRLILSGGQPPKQQRLPSNTRYLWIRLALFDKQLVKIVDHLVENSSKYYEKDAFVSDPVSGQILASLLVGPCALDYSRVKTQDHYWTDPPADELVQRHKLSSSLPQTSNPTTPPQIKRPGLNYRKGVKTSGSSSEDSGSLQHGKPRDYVESLHQNSKSTLLYGKNNVVVQPRDNLEAMRGYLSLHSETDGLFIKWTPNQLMNGCCENNSSGDSVSSENKSVFWEYALSVKLDDVVYLHCHQTANTGGTVVLVGQDGVQRPPFHFPRGGHLLAFLSCLENGLLPEGQLDPPLWSQHGRGKVFPRLKRNSRSPSRGVDSSGEEEEEVDFVFRVLTAIKSGGAVVGALDYSESVDEGGGQQPLKSPLPTTAQQRVHILKHHSSSASSASAAEDSPRHNSQPPTLLSPGQSIRQLCDTMKRQIISRAFYGWLAYCRHLRTVRTHLSVLVNSTIVKPDPELCKGVTPEAWERLMSTGVLADEMELYTRVYFGGVEHSLRKEVWLFLLGHYRMNSTKEEREEHDKSVTAAYENTVSEWLAVETIVRQRDKEAAQAAKLSSESTTSEIPLAGPQDATHLSNEVFDASDDDDSDSDSDAEEKAKRKEEMMMQESKTEVQESKSDADDADQVNDAAAIGDMTKQDSKDSEQSEGSRRGKLLRAQKVDSQSNIIVTNPSIDAPPASPLPRVLPVDSATAIKEEPMTSPDTALDVGGQLAAPDEHSNCASPASSSAGGIYSTDLLDLFALNLHRIDKDVRRCDRNYPYFAPQSNLDKLRTIMCSYVWEHLDVGYVQGMCDLVAPLLVIFDDEVLTYNCFCALMKRMVANFPHGGAMDAHFANMRSLIQILDAEMFELMHENGDYTHFYFCYRWFLLDFKRELLYSDVFLVWETIWAAARVASPHMVLFIALAMVRYYRDIILDNSMDFTDIIKFFNEMAERHDMKAILQIARDLVLQIQTLIDN